MRRRDFFKNLVGLAGAVAIPALAVSAETVSGEEFQSHEQQYCSVCDCAMFAEKIGKDLVFSCPNSYRKYPTGKILESLGGGMVRMEMVENPGCPIFGIKYRAPKVRMERV